MSRAVFLVLAAATVHSTTARECSTPEWGKCNGPNNEVLCCPDGFYCQPRFPTFYQCMKQPVETCAVIEIYYDYIGNDADKFYGLTPDECCQRCAHPDCWWYTYVNQRPNHPPGACYLKNGATNRTYVQGAITGEYFILKVTDRP